MKPLQIQTLLSLLLGVVCVLPTHAQEAVTLPIPVVPPVPTAPAAPQGYTLDNLIQLSLQQNPALSQAQFDVEAAQGKAAQAGRYPNPTVSIGGEEIGRRGGIQTLPLISQEIVTGNKLGLSKSIALREVDQAGLSLLTRRLTLFTTVRQGYFEVLVLQRRQEILTEMVQLAAKSLANAQTLQKAKQIAELDVLPFQIEMNRLKLDADAARREYQAAWGRLAAAVGAPTLPPAPVFGSLEDPLPSYELSQVQALIMEQHPEVQFAQVGIARAQLVVQREQAQAKPNFTVSVGYQRNFNDRDNQAIYQIGMPIPIFNRNEGNIRAAQAELGRAVREVHRVQGELASKLATAYGQYAVARQRSELFKTTILPDAEKGYQLSLAAFKGGQFEYIRVLQAQRTLVEIRQEYLRAQGDAWRAASEIAGLTLEESWPAGVSAKQ